MTDVGRSAKNNAAAEALIDSVRCGGMCGGTCGRDKWKGLLATISLPQTLPRAFALHSRSCAYSCFVTVLPLAGGYDIMYFPSDSSFFIPVSLSEQAPDLGDLLLSHDGRGDRQDRGPGPAWEGIGEVQGLLGEG